MSAPGGSFTNGSVYEGLWFYGNEAPVASTNYPEQHCFIRLERGRKLLKLLNGTYRRTHAFVSHGENDVTRSKPGLLCRSTDLYINHEHTGRIGIKAELAGDFRR